MEKIEPNEIEPDEEEERCELCGRAESAHPVHLHGTGLGVCKGHYRPDNIIYSRLDVPEFNCPVFVGAGKKLYGEARKKVQKAARRAAKIILLEIPWTGSRRGFEYWKKVSHELMRIAETGEP